MKIDIDKPIKIVKLDSINPGNLQDGYWLTGFLARPICVGKTVKVWRYANSNRPDGFPGVFETTVVQEWDGKTFKTNNSSYSIEQI